MDIISDPKPLKRQTKNKKTLPPEDELYAHSLGKINEITYNVLHRLLDWHQ